MSPTCLLAPALAEAVAPSAPRPPRRSTPSKLTLDSANYDKQTDCFGPILNTWGAERARAHMIIRYGDTPRPSYAKLQKELGFDSRQAVSKHVDRLVEEGILVRPGGQQAPILTPAGRTCCVYLRAHAGGETVLRRLVRQAFGSWRRDRALAMLETAEEMDSHYSLTREGLTWTDADGKSRSEKRVPYKKVLAALRTCTTVDGAARKAGIDQKSLRKRVETLIKHARKRLDQ